MQYTRKSLEWATLQAVRDAGVEEDAVFAGDVGPDSTKDLNLFVVVFFAGATYPPGVSGGTVSYGCAIHARARKDLIETFDAIIKQLRTSPQVTATVTAEGQDPSGVRFILLTLTDTS